MHYTLPIIGSLCAVASARCGAVPHANVPAMHAAYQAHKAAQRGPIRRQSTTIMTYFNVITENDTLAGGNVPQENIDQQVRCTPKGLPLPFKNQCLLVSFCRGTLHGANMNKLALSHTGGRPQHRV